MTTKTNETTIPFDVMRTLGVIENDADLLSLFKDKITTDITVTKSLAEKKLLTEDAIAYLEKLYTVIILTKKDLMSKYVRIKPSPEVETPKSAKKYPRRYGKAQIMKDVKQQGGTMTEGQRMLLALNELKNTYVKLSVRGIRHINGGEQLTDTECRDIIGTVETVNKKLSHIIKRKLK